MAGYDSPIGRKQFQGQHFREVAIPDETGAVPPPQPPQPPQQPQYQQFDDAAIREFNARMRAQSNTTSQDQADLERQFREARDAKRFGRERLSDGARRRIEMLVGMTRHTRVVNIENNNYVLQTLRDKELQDAVLSASAVDGTVQSPFEIRKQLLVRSLVQIAGMDADQFFGSSDVMVKLEGLEMFDHYLLGRLYDEYLAMVKEAREKYAVKTEEDIREVVEDLKK